MQEGYTAKEIAEFLGADIRGDKDAQIYGLNTLSNAIEGELSFLSNPRYKRELDRTKASFVILSVEDSSDYSGSCFIVENPYLAYAKISHWFCEDKIKRSADGGIPKIAENAVISSGVVIGNDSTVGDFTELGANVSIGSHVRIGKHTRVFPNVSIYDDVVIGDNVIIHSNSVIGSDGFGMARREDGSWEKIAQLGIVNIGNDVEIGACCAIDRGALGNTTINNGVKLDNHIQIAHNVVIGENTVMAAYCGIAGSSVIGKNCVFGGDVCVVGHVEVCDSVMITARTLVTKSISKPGSYSSGTTPLMDTKSWRKNAVRFTQLDKIAKKLNKITNMD